MASPTVSYMRSLSFATAAPHHSHSAWAAAASSSVNAARSQQLYLSNHHSINSHNTNTYTHHLHNFNSHHDRAYTHHLHQFHHQGGVVGYTPDPPGSMMATTTTALARTRPASFASPAPSGGRRRSSSIRSRNPPPFIKFDPFADEPTGPEKSLTSALAVQPKPISASNPTTLYTIEIPAAGTTELQRYAVRSPPHSSARRFSFAANNNTVGNSLGGGNSHSPSEKRATLPPALSRPPPPPLAPSPSLRSSPSPPPLVRRPLLSGPGTLGGPNVSKLVAGILLNRVTAGKPLRRRVPSFGEKKAYVKSCLSSVVSVEA